MRVYTVRRPDVGIGPQCTFRSMAAIQDAEFCDAEVGDSITVTLNEMTEEEFNALPEFNGW